MARNINAVMRQILALIPDSFEKKNNINSAFQKISDDLPYRAPEIIYLSWEELSNVLSAYLYKDAMESPEWGWRDDVFELFSDGNWSKTVFKAIK